MNLLLVQSGLAVLKRSCRVNSAANNLQRNGGSGESEGEEDEDGELHVDRVEKNVAD